MEDARTRVSTMTIAAPQSGQTKVGWVVVPAEVSSFSGDASGVVCKRLRTSTRFFLRLALASSP